MPPDGIEGRPIPPDGIEGRPIPPDGIEGRAIPPPPIRMPPPPPPKPPPRPPRADATSLGRTSVAMQTVTNKVRTIEVFMFGFQIRCLFR